MRLLKKLFLTEGIVAALTAVLIVGFTVVLIYKNTVLSIIFGTLLSLSVIMSVVLFMMNSRKENMEFLKLTDEAFRNIEEGESQKQKA